MLEPTQAYETLEVYFAPDRNAETQREKMRTDATTWAYIMRAEKISRADTWLAYHSTLAYPLLPTPSHKY
jgi:hypothetical protein